MRSTVNTYKEIPYRKLSSGQRRLLESVLSTQSKSKEEVDMINRIKTELKKMQSVHSIYFFEDKKGNIYVRKTNIEDNNEYYPLLVAHMDTVHDIKPYRTKKDDKHNRKKDETYQLYKFESKSGGGWTYDSDTGIGGDDKNGVFILLSLLWDHTIPRLKCFFPVEEETGRDGAEFALKNNRTFFDNISYMIEPDRRGNDDIIARWGSGFTMNDEFYNLVKPIFKKNKYEVSPGSVTDIFTLFEEVEISCFNISCGYYRPHSNSEYVVEHDIRRSMDTVKEILHTIPLSKRYEQKYESYVPQTYGYGYPYNDYGYNRDYSKRKTIPMKSKYNKIQGLFYNPFSRVKQYGYYNPSARTFNILTVKGHRITHIFSDTEKMFIFVAFAMAHSDKFIEHGILDEEMLLEYNALIDEMFWKHCNYVEKYPEYND